MVDTNLVVSAFYFPGGKPEQIKSRADFIISGDRHLTSLRTFQGIKIVDPANFLALITEAGGR